MDSSSGIAASLPGRYAIALHGLAQEKLVVDAVEGDMASIGSALADSPEFAQFITDPKVSRKNAVDVVTAIGAKFKLNPITIKFLGVLAENRRLAQLGAIAQAFATIAAGSRGESTAEVTSAHPLSPAQLKALASQLAAREGREIKIEHNIDPEILGGLVVRLGSQMIDSSIRTRLNSLAIAMKG